MRLRSFVVILVGILCVLGARLLHLQVFSGRALYELSERNCIRVWSQGGSRGRVFDRNGETILDNRVSYDIAVFPREESLLKESLRLVGDTLGLPLEKVQRIYRANLVSSSVPVTVARDVPLRSVLKLSELQMETGGIFIQQVPVRAYPFGTLACHALGYLNEIDQWRLTKLKEYGYRTKDLVGYTGIEEKYDYYLRPKDGGYSVEVNHRGKPLRVLGFRQPQNGKDIRLTLDVRIQQIVEAHLKARKGAVIVMDPFTGEIRALASFPGFDPSVFQNAAPAGAQESLRSAEAPFLNRCISSAYPPASTFKLNVATAALERDKLPPGRTYDCPGSFTLGKAKFGCWDTHGRENLTDAIAHSCNVFFFRTALLLGAQALHDFALKLGFGKTTDIDIPYEVRGFVPSPLWKKVSRLQPWFDGDTLNFSIGQGDMLATPLQVLRMSALFANAGSLVTPYLVSTVDTVDVSRSKRSAVRVGLKESTIEAVRRGMLQMTRDPKGTGHLLADIPVSIAGKTGTAQVPKGLSHGWFTAFFPFEKPRYCIVVFLEHGGSGHAACMVGKYIIKDMVEQKLIQ